MNPAPNRTRHRITSEAETVATRRAPQPLVQGTAPGG